MTQAILLVGGKGTRLLPLTRSVPKPMLPIAGLPVTEHQLLKAKAAGITSIVLATSYLADVFIPYFGDGSKWGLELQYAVETEPLGTGGAIANAASKLSGDEPIVIFNGDVLSSHNLSAQIKLHQEREADVTLHLTHVPDARAFGCVPLDADGRVTAFLEKMENPVTNTINAGCYIFNPTIINQIPRDTVVSIEREIFPELVKKGKNVFGIIDDAYWLDIGTPAALLQGSRDAVLGKGVDFLVMEGCSIDVTAHLSSGSAMGRGVVVGARARIDGSIVSDVAQIQDDAVVTGSFIAQGAVVEKNAQIHDSYVAKDGIFPL